MKKILNIVLSAFVILLCFVGCDKADELTMHSDGVEPVLAASSDAAVITTANSTNNLLTFSWSNPEFATDTVNYKYKLQFAKTGNSFANPISYELTESRSMSFTGVELNNLVLSLGGTVGAANPLDVRVLASYANNNDLRISNVLTVNITPAYLPFTLANNNAGPIDPTLDNKDDVTATLSWTKPAYGNNAVEYELEYDKTGDNFNSVFTMPVGTDLLTKGLTYGQLNTMAYNSGIDYGVTGQSVDVRVKATIAGTSQSSTSNVITIQINPVALTIFMWVPGDYQGWNPGDDNYRIASTDGINFEGYIYVPAATGPSSIQEFKFTSHPDWAHTAYGGTATTLSTSGGNLVWPNDRTVGRYYKVNVNLSALTWTAVQTDWGIIGAATPNGWGSSTALTYDVASRTWRGTMALSAGEYKFRANDSWDINLGGSATGLNYGGGNMNVATGGTYNIVLNLSNAPVYTSSVTP